MDGTTHRFTDLGTLADDVHALFDGWIEATGGDGLVAEPDAMTLLRLKLAVHEWMANIIQHAHFPEHPPEVRLTLTVLAEGIECVVEDTSEGFDLEGQLAVRAELLEPLPERGMGLLMLRACARRLSYGPVVGGGRRLVFLVAPPEQDVFLDLFS